MAEQVRSTDNTDERARFTAMGQKTECRNGQSEVDQNENIRLRGTEHESTDGEECGNCSPRTRSAERITAP